MYGAKTPKPYQVSKQTNKKQAEMRNFALSSLF